MINNVTKIFLLLLISSSFQACNGQNKSEPKQRETETTEIGKIVSELDNQIWAVFQDQKGNFWFGSNGTGIYFYDGKELKRFTQNDGLVSNQIRGIQEDIEGNVYIETPKGVNKFDGIEFTTLEIIKSSTNQWKLEPNDLWFNCNGNANNVYRYDGKNIYELRLPKQDLENKLNINESSNPYTVFGIDKDRDGNIWFGTVLAGAFRFDGNSFLWIGEKELSRLPDGREPGVRSILEDNDGNIWLSNFKSKYRIKSDLTKEYEKHKAVELSEEIIRDKILYFNSGIEDTEGNLWMTTYGGVVWKYDGQELLNFEINNGKEDVLLICIYQDNNGTIWLGTNNDGVYKQTGKGFIKFEPKT
jgi:ligand-binding sensor domain-containing protein